jgi:hypothetical protein
MRRVLLLAMLGVTVSVGWARADGIPQHYPWPRPTNHGFGPHTTSVTWPSVVPPGWYSNTYNYRWYYPWFAYYNYSSSPYANWPATRGVAGYANHGPAGIYYWPNPTPAQPYLGQWAAGSTSSSFSTLQGLTAPQKMTSPTTPTPPTPPKPKD